MATRRSGVINVKEEPTEIKPPTFQIENEFFAIKTDNSVNIDELPKEQESVPEVPVEEPNETIESEMKVELEEEGSKVIAEWVDKRIQEDLKILPTEPIVKKKKEVKDLNQTELRTYQRTGFLPEY